MVNVVETQHPCPTFCTILFNNCVHMYYCNQARSQIIVSVIPSLSGFHSQIRLTGCSCVIWPAVSTYLEDVCILFVQNRLKGDGQEYMRHCYLHQFLLVCNHFNCTSAINSEQEYQLYTP